MNALGHAWQSVVIRDATCETEGKVLKICSRCGLVENEHAQKGEHQYETHTVGATCGVRGIRSGNARSAETAISPI